MVDILTAFGVGSGIDTTKLVSDLVAASRSGRDATIASKTTTNTARLTTISTLSSGLSDLATSAKDRLETIADTDLAQFVRDLVATVNVIRDEVNTATRAGAAGADAGPLVSDPGTRTLARDLSQLAGKAVVSSGTYQRLSDLGVSTGRDGKLSIDETKLRAAIANDPTAVRAVLGAGNTSTGLAASLKSLYDKTAGTNGGLKVAQSRYQRVAQTLSDDKAKLEEQMAKLSERLTKTYSAMDRQVASIKASQEYLKQQIAVWTNSNN